MRTVRGTFDVSMDFEPPYHEAHGVKLARASASKRFSGPLEGVSEVAMLSARTPVAHSAGYVAIELVQGTLEGKQGTFVLQHSGLMHAGEERLRVDVVPDSGTGELAGLRGELRIELSDGQHSYELDYDLKG